MPSPIATEISNFEFRICHRTSHWRFRISDLAARGCGRVDLGGLPAVGRRGCEFSILSSDFLPVAGISAAVGGCRDLEFVLWWWWILIPDSGFQVGWTRLPQVDRHCKVLTGMELLRNIFLQVIDLHLRYQDSRGCIYCGSFLGWGVWKN